jgi:hypothetical protein
MNISTLIKRQEIVIDKYLNNQKDFEPTVIKHAPTKSVKGIISYYITYLLDIYINALKICNRQMFLKITLSKDIVECYYLY